MLNLGGSLSLRAAGAQAASLPWKPCVEILTLEVPLPPLHRVGIVLLGSPLPPHNSFSLAIKRPYNLSRSAGAWEYRLYQQQAVCVFLQVFILHFFSLKSLCCSVSLYNNFSSFKTLSPPAVILLRSVPNFP